MDDHKNHKYYKIIQGLHTPSTGKPRKLNLEDEKVVAMLIPVLLEIAFEGTLNDGYFAWGTGSWLDSDIKEVFSKAEDKFGKNIYEYLDEFGKDKTYEEWKNVFLAYLLLPINSYKQEIDFDLENLSSILPIKNEFGKIAWIELNQEWLKTIDHKISFPEGTSLDEKFSAYLTSKFFPKALKSHFGIRLDDEKTKEFTKLFSNQNESTQIKIKDAMIDSNSKFWRKLGKKIGSEKLNINGRI